MTKPDYRGGSLLNLMATLETALGLPPPLYAPLAPQLGLSAEDLADSRQVVLLVIDGLGDELLARLAPDSLLARHRIARLTSVFPSTTASAIPTFFTGLPPQAHALTGWHMWFGEIGQTLAVLPLAPHNPVMLPGVDPATLPARLFAHRPLSERLAGRVWNVAPEDIIDSPFNAFHTAGARRIGYQGTAGLFAAIESAVAAAAGLERSVGPAYIHGYYPVLDSLMHSVGTTDERVAKRLAKLDAELAACLERLAGTGTSLVVTADHGFIDAPPRRLIELDQHPELAALLERPLCGERRVAYAYVRPGREAQFEAYVRAHLGHACEIHGSADFIAAGWFGPGPAHPSLMRRAGDFVLLMRDDWTIKDWLPGERRYQQLGVHGGASPAEMHIPLIHIACF